jgi:hypothetical protein
MILNVMTVYNELEFMPFREAWCKKEGVDLYVIDNYSDDGTWEWLCEHEIPSHRFDTGGAFHLDKLQAEIVYTVDQIKPDWVLYSGADLFTFVDWGVSFLVDKCNTMGANIIELPMIDVCRVDGETGDPFKCMYYRNARDRIGFLYKWEPKAKYTADYVDLMNRRPVTGPGIMMNYGRTKSKDKRVDLLRRRQKAWKQGLDRTSGRHYLREKQKGYKWDPRELKRLDNSEYWKYVKEFNKYLDKEVRGGIGELQHP